MHKAFVDYHGFNMDADDAQRSGIFYKVDCCYRMLKLTWAHLLKKSAQLINLVGDKAPLAARDSREVSRI